MRLELQLLHKMSPRACTRKRKNDSCRDREDVVKIRKGKHYPEFPSQPMTEVAKAKMMKIIKELLRLLHILPSLPVKGLEKDEPAQTLLQVIDRVKANYYHSTDDLWKEIYDIASQLISENQTKTSKNIKKANSSSPKLIRGLIELTSQEFPSG